MIGRFVAIALVLTLLLSADDTKLSKKGQKIAESLCDGSTLPKKAGTVEQMMIDIKASHSCPSLSKSKLKSIALYLLNGANGSTNNRRISVPESAKCPVCGMFVHKYPKGLHI